MTESEFTMEDRFVPDLLEVDDDEVAWLRLKPWKGLGRWNWHEWAEYPWHKMVLDYCRQGWWDERTEGYRPEDQFIQIFERERDDDYFFWIVGTRNVTILWITKEQLFETPKYIMTFHVREVRYCFKDRNAFIWLYYFGNHNFSVMTSDGRVHRIALMPKPTSNWMEIIID